MECEHCHKQFGAKSSLIRHQQSAKFCIRIREETKTKPFSCSGCGRELVSKQRLNSHHMVCEKFATGNRIDQLEKIIDLKNRELETRDASLVFKDATIEKLEQHIRDLEDKIVKIAMKHTNTTKTSNTYVYQNFTPITDEKLKQDAVNFTKEHLVLGGQGVAKFALETSLKDNFICTDVSRGHVKYMDSNGDMVIDPGATTIARRVCSSIVEPAEKINLDVKSTLSGTTADSDLIRAVLIDETVNDIRQVSNGVENDLVREFVKTVSATNVKKIST